MSLEIARRLERIDDFSRADTIFLYAGFRSEVATDFLMRSCLASGKRVAVPLNVVKEKKLIPCEVVDPDKDLRPGYCSIPEPDPAGFKFVGPETIDVVILPGSVFDEKGGRLGYGGGYYDRFLLTSPRAMKIGIAFEMQVVKELPLMPHDQKIDMLVTENRVMSFAR